MTSWTNVSLPSQRRALLHCDTRLNVRWQHAVSILLGLVLEDLPGRHGYHARADAFREQLFVRCNGQADFTARSDQDYFGITTRRVSQYIRATRDTGGRCVLAAIQRWQRLARQNQYRRLV